MSEKNPILCKGLLRMESDFVLFCFDNLVGKNWFFEGLKIDTQTIEGFKSIV